MTDIYQSVTDRMIAALERGAPPWVKPWKSDGTRGPFELDVNHVTGRAYNGTNLLVLWDQRMQRGYERAEWLTYKQATEAGGQVRRGEKGAQVVFWKFRDMPSGAPQDASDTSEASEASEGEPGRTRRAALARAYTVFNVEQCDGLTIETVDFGCPIETRLANAQAFCDATGARVVHGGNLAGYLPMTDVIRMPTVESFDTQEHYFATKLHELTHWTGHATRCDRQLKNRFGDAAYAAEELIAELGAAFACAALGITGDLRHAGYIEHWLKVLREDSRAIFTAASQARKAHEYLVSLQPAAVEAAE
jgi:antirestriction protein ArdC